MAATEANHDSESVRNQFVEEFDATNDDGLGYIGKANVIALVPSHESDFYGIEFDELDTVVTGFKPTVHQSVKCLDATKDGETIGVYNVHYIQDICDILDITLSELATYCVVRAVDTDNGSPIVIETDDWYICIAGRVTDI